MSDTTRMGWRKLREKVLVKYLARDDKRGLQFDIIKLEAYTTYPEHKHADFEWVYVLKGDFSDESGNFHKGEFKINPKNSKHSITTGKNGCELLVCWCGRLS